MVVGWPVGLLLGIGPAAFTFIGAWVLGTDLGTLLYGWWNTAPPSPGYQVILLGMLPLGLAGLIAGPGLLEVYARIASALLGPTQEEMAARLGQLAQSRSQVVDASAAELRGIERDLHDGAQARLVSVGMSIGLAEAVRAVAAGGTAIDPEVVAQLLAGTPGTSCWTGSRRVNARCSR